MELAKCCATCAHCENYNRSNQSLCHKMEELYGLKIYVNKCLLCEQWLTAEEGKPRFSWDKPKKRNAYWKKMVTRINERIKQAISNEGG